ncbi:CC0125/CC1285 family lipoprotein [Hyphomonas johnsonii]|uniref:Lipoprotein n=1 Tax=Hyphomonas johnsonii MHS-2 TaxID=1280950 RepID=A0A059FV08_9PROT|nr:hypothetical protein [Hyphomonas johnsonii]KCZ94437.1 hypothetical protein HJO_03645 [Hyphomonas johnsonii MHS-2]
MTKFLFLVLSVAFISACTVGQATPYRAEYDSVWSGYGSRVTDLGGNRYEIYNHASPITPANVPGEHNMLRAAQLAIEKGFDFFEIESNDNKTDLVRAGSAGTFGRPAARLVVKLARTQEPGADAHDANAVAERLGKKYLKN